MSKSNKPNVEEAILVDEPKENGSAAPIQTVDQAVKPELARFDKYEARYNELKAQYGAIKINGLEDRDGYSEAKTAVRELRTIRTGSEDDRKAAKSFYLECGRAIDKKAAWIEETILSLENPIKKQIEAIDTEKDRLKAEKIAMESKRLIGRTSRLKELGADFDGNNFFSDDLSYEISVVRESSDQLFEDNILPKFRKIFETKEAIRLQEQDKKDVEAAELKRQQEELERQKKELADQQDKLRIAKEKADKESADIAEAERKKKIEAEKKLILERVHQLQEIVWTGLSYSYSRDTHTILVKQEQLIQMTEDDFVKFRDTHNSRVAKDRLEFQKVQEEIATKNAELKRQGEEQKRKEELERASDKEKFTIYIDHVTAVPYPELKSRYWRDKLNIVKEKMEELKEL